MIWKDIPGYEGSYEVSEFAYIKRLKEIENVK